MKIRVSCGRGQEAATVRRTKYYGYPFFSAIAVLLAVFAIHNEPPGLWTIYGSLSLATAVLVVGMALLARGQAPQQVRVARDTGGLCFGPPPAADIGVTLAMGVALVTAALVWLDPDQLAEFSFRERSAAYGVPLLGAYAIGSKLWSLRRPVGLTLSEVGLSGVRGGPLVDAMWDGIARIVVNERRGIRSVCIVMPHVVHVIPMHALAGDAYAVATIVNYYLQNPDERGRLVDGVAAVRHVDGEVRAGRFGRL